MKLISIKKFESKISKLLIDKNTEDSPYPDDMVNAYNWGLMHASYVLEGRDVEFIKGLR